MSCSTHIVNHSSGFFAPKIKGDPIFEAISSLNGFRKAGSGDAISTVCNFVGTAARTAAHALTLANLATNPNPFAAVTSLLLDRFVVGPVLTNSKTTVDRRERVPHQSDIQIGVLRVDNSRTHLEGVWKAGGKGRSYIRTGEFSTDSPQAEVEQSVKGKGWSLSFSASALMGFALGFPVVGAASCLQNVSLFRSEAKVLEKSVHPMVLDADDLLVVCDNAVFRGSKIHARLLEVLVSGDLTIESLKNEFRSSSHGAEIGLKLDGVSALMSETGPMRGFLDSVLSAAPHLRVADEWRLSERVGEVAELVGREEFYLTVGKVLHKIGATAGLKPDGVVTKSERERIRAGKLLEERVREAERHKRRVFNPSVAEFVSMIGEVDAFKRIQAQVELQQIKEGKSLEDREKTRRRVARYIAAVKEEEKVEQKRVRKAAEEIVRNDARLKSEVSRADSNKKKAHILANEIIRINRKQAVVAVEEPETLVQEAAQRTELELLAVAKRKYFEDLRELERREKVQRADEAVRSRQTLIWSQLDDPNCVDLSNIKIENEGAIRAAARQNVAKEFKHYRHVVDAHFCAQCRFLKGEGYVESISKEIEQDSKAPTFVKEINSARNRMERLKQEELSRIGENFLQRIAKIVPLLGSCVEYHYDPDASWGDFGKSLGIDAAFCMMPIPGGGAVKAVGKAAKTATTVEKVAGTAEKIADAALKMAGKAEAKAVASKATVAKAEITAANQAATDAFRKNVQKNLLKKGEYGVTEESIQQTKKLRIQRTSEDVVDYFKKLRKDKNWKFFRKNGNRTAYKNNKTGEIRYNDDTHHEIECFDSKRRHSVLDPVTETKLNKQSHEFPKWLKE